MDRTHTHENPAGRENRGMIDSLIEMLASRDGMERQRARTMLVQIGAPAVKPIMALLEDERRAVRWEAARALATMKDPRAAGALVHTMEDTDSDVRWLAAEALINLQDAAMVPVLEALTVPSISNRLRDGAHHVLRALRRGWPAVIASPVVEALDNVDPQLTVPDAAKKALAAIQRMKEKEKEKTS